MEKETSVTYDYNTGKPLAPGQSQSLYNTSTGQRIGDTGLNTYPVVTSSAAKDDLNKIKSSYNEIKSNMDNQALSIAREKEQPKIGQNALSVVSYKDNPDGTTTNTLSDGSKSTVKYIKNVDGTLQPVEVNSTESNSYDPYASLSSSQADRTSLVNEGKKVYEETMNTINGIKSGSVPLDPSQIAQIESLRQSYQKLIQNQGLANITDAGQANLRGYQKGAAEYDPTFQNRVIGEVVAGGQRKIAELNNQMADAVSKLTLAFKTDNIKLAKDAYEMYQKSYSERMEAVDKFVSEAQTEIKRVEEKRAEQQKQIDDILLEASKNGAPSDIQNKVRSATNKADAVAAAGDYLQSTSGDIGSYNLYRRQALASGITPIGYDAWLDKEANRKKTASGSSGLPASTITQIDKLSSSFDNAPITKQYNEAVNKKLTFDSILQDGVSGPEDVALVYEFMKALDPQSVVRETEYETARKSGNLFQGVYAKFNGYLKDTGGFLPPNVRQEFASIVDKKLGAITKQYENLRNETARKINIKTGETDGADYLTNYSLSLGDNVLKEQKTLQEQIDDLYLKSPQNVRDAIDELESIGASDEEIQRELSKRGYVSMGGQYSADDAAKALAVIESSNSYDAVSPVNKNGKRAYGKYQIMETNIPSWSKEALGREVSLNEFRKNPDIQEAIAKFKIAQIYNEYGGNVDDVASIWFSGKPYKGNVAADVTGTDVPTYVDNFRKALQSLT